jgi:hypothetical protein
MPLRSIIIGIAAITLAASAIAAELPADGKSKRRAFGPAPCCGEIYRYVYAEGWYGSRKLVAPVRHGVGGDEVGLPTGDWQPCQLSCEETLRKQHLYFWQDFGATTPGLVPPEVPRSDFFRDDHGNRYDYIF